MFENLLNLVKEHAGPAIVDNPAIPNQHNDAAIKEATTGIMDQLKSSVASGGIGQLTSMFSGGNTASNPMVQNISASVAKNLASKFGISPQQANNIVQSLIPKVMAAFVSKTNDPNDKSFDIKDIISSLSGGKGVDDLMGGLKKMF